MAKLLKLRRGTTTQHGSFTGAEGEVTIDTTKDTAVVHDGSTAGGRPLARQDMNNVPAGTILGTQLENSGVTAGAYGSSSAIPIVTVDAQGLVTAASTTAIDSTTIANGTSSVAVANNGDITSTRGGTARLTVTDAGATINGQVTSNTLKLASNAPQIIFEDQNNNPDFEIHGNSGALTFVDSTNSANRLIIQNDGTVDVQGNLDANGGLDVTGTINSSGKVDCQAGLETDGDVKFNSGTTNVNVLFDASTSNMRFSDSMSQTFGDHSTSGDYSLTYVNGGDFTINAMSGGSGDLVIGRYENAAQKKHIVSTRAGVAELYHDNSKKLNTAAGGVDVTGNITVTGTVDGVDIAALNLTAASLSSVNGSLANLSLIHI